MTYHSITCLRDCDGFGCWCRCFCHETFAERFWRKVALAGEDDCWHFTGCVTRAGYGRVSAGSALGGPRKWSAHRVSYTIAVGPVPPDMEIDHVCHNKDADCSGGSACLHRRCVNPKHLEPVTHRENDVRGGQRLATFICGHPKTPSNSGRNGGVTKAKCKTCHAKRMRDQRRRNT